MDYYLLPENRGKSPQNPFSGSATVPAKRFASFSGSFLTLKKTGGLLSRPTLSGSPVIASTAAPLQEIDEDSTTTEGGEQVALAKKTR